MKPNAYKNSTMGLLLLSLQGSQSVPAVIGCWRSCQVNAQNQTTIQTLHTCQQPINLTSMSLDCGRILQRHRQSSTQKRKMVVLNQECKDQTLILIFLLEDRTDDKLSPDCSPECHITVPFQKRLINITEHHVHSRYEQASGFNL